MLAWKWWRDCRGRVILYFVAAAAFGVLAAVEGAAFYRWTAGDWNDPARTNFYRMLMSYRVRYGLLYPAWYGGMWMGLALAISSFGKDYASSALAFLTTRPRSRIAMLWTDWALAQTAVVLATGALVGSATITVAGWMPLLRTSLWWFFPAGIVGAVAVYGVTLFFTALTRSAVRGVELTVATMITVWLIPGAVREWWHIAWPEQLQIWMMRIFAWSPMESYWTSKVRVLVRPGLGAKRFVMSDRTFVYHNLEPFPVAALAIWVAIGLAFMYATQKMIERREV